MIWLYIVIAALIIIFLFAIVKKLIKVGLIVGIVLILVVGGLYITGNKELAKDIPGKITGAVAKIDDETNASELAKEKSSELIDKAKDKAKEEIILYLEE